MSRKGMFFRKRGGYLLDIYSNGFIGFSLRKLSSSATYAIRVRRDSDNAETDVELYDDGTSIDLSSTVSAGGTFSTWVGSNSAYVTIWYNQGTAHDVANTTPSTQPRIVNTGTLDVKSSIAGIKYSLDDLLFNATQYDELDNGNDFSFFAVVANGANNKASTIISTAVGGADRYHLYKDNRTSPKRIAAIVTTGTDALVDLTTADTSQNQKLIVNIVDGTASSHSGWADGTAGSQNITWTGTYQNTDAYIGYNAASTILKLEGYLQEIVGFSEKKDSDRIDIQNNINTHYSIY